jgi:two-component system, sensor histidine kinase RpfC
MGAAFSRFLQGSAGRRTRSNLFAGRPDREHEMVVNRLVIGGLILGYLLISRASGVANVEQPLTIIILYCLGGGAFLLHILKRPGSSPVRRILAMTMDLGTLSYGLYAGGEVTALLYPIYLWVIFGNGFRFGVRYLFAAMSIAVSGFLIVCLSDGYWNAHPPLAIGLLAGLVVIPTYASTLIRKLSLAKQQADEANKQKSLFLASVSHELRTPLNAIIGLSDLMKDTPLDADQRDMCHTIRTSGQTLLDHINDILHYSRLEAGQMPCERLSFDLHELLIDIVAMTRAQACAKGVAVGLYIDSRTPHGVVGDRKQLHKVLVNLAGNAVKFTSKGFVFIEVRGDVGQDGRVQLRLEVVDSGIGVAAEARDRIFDRFTQADETIINSFGGTGLGLATAKQLVELNGGRIGIESEPGVGSTFWFEFVLDLDPAHDNEAWLCDGNELISPIVVSAAPDAAALIVRLMELGCAPRLARGLEEAGALLADDSRQGRSAVPILIDGRTGEETYELAAALTAADPRRTRSMVLIQGLDAVSGPAQRLPFVTALPWPQEYATLLAAWRIARLPELLEQRRRTAGAIAAASKQQMPRLNILVAEDNVTNQMVIEKILQAAGQEARIVENGRLALDMMLTERFDVVLMDVNMPEMNGLEATRRYCETVAPSSRAVVIALTADATAEARAACQEAGMVACALKPIEPEKLFALFKQHLSGWEHLPLDDDQQANADGNAALGASKTRVSEAHEHGRPVPDEVIDREVLKRLEQLGGAEFREEVTTAFLLDAHVILDDLEAATRALDDTAFRDLVHAMRSSAANVGAVGLFEVCLALRAVDRDQMQARGQEYLDALSQKLESARLAFDAISRAA